MSSAQPDIQQDSIAKLGDEIIEAMVKDLRKFLRNAQVAVFNSDDKVHTTFTATVSLKKKIVADESKISMEIDSRERIPNPVIRRELEFNKGKQLVLV